MKKQTPKEILASRILMLSMKQDGELILLKDQFFTTYENFSFMFIKNSLRGLVSSTDKGSSSLLDTAIGLSTGFLSKKLLIGGTHNPVKKILGGLLQFAVAKIVSTHTDTIKSTGGKLFTGILSKLTHKDPAVKTTNAYDTQSSNQLP